MSIPEDMNCMLLTRISAIIQLLLKVQTYKFTQFPLTDLCQQFLRDKKEILLKWSSKHTLLSFEELTKKWEKFTTNSSKK